MAICTVKSYLGFSCILAIAALSAQHAPPKRLVIVESSRLPVPKLTSAGSATQLPDLPREVTAAQYSPEYARHSLVPLMGGSIAVGDFDGDKLPDLYVTRPGVLNSLFRNNGDGTFQEVTAKAHVPGLKGSLSATFADYDRSGRPSLFVVGFGGVVLYRNNGDGTFADITQEAGLNTNSREIFTKAILADVDGDGFADLLLTVYTDLDHPPKKARFLFPNDFAGCVSRLYRNDGHGRFTDVTASAGLGGNSGRARNALVADFNGDGRPDFLVLRDDKPPALYLNEGQDRFADASWKWGQELTGHAFFEGMVADFNLDGKPDVALWSNISFRVLLNSGKMTFQRAGALPGPPPLPTLFGFHGTVTDLDGNGFDDVITVDSMGQLHVFANNAGQFYELRLELPQGLEGGFLKPGWVDNAGRRYILLGQPDGRIAMMLCRVE